MYIINILFIMIGRLLLFHDWQTSIVLWSTDFCCSMIDRLLLFYDRQTSVVLWLADSCCSMIDRLRWFMIPRFLWFLIVRFLLRKRLPIMNSYQPWSADFGAPELKINHLNHLRELTVHVRGVLFSHIDTWKTCSSLVNYIFTSLKM